MNLFQEAKNVLDKNGKVNPLGPYGKQKLTGREMSTYFRRNKVGDAQIKKAVEVALDLGGADTIARQEIKKFYGSKILKSKEVQNALQYANEEVQESTDLSENYRKLARYGMGTETSKSARVGLELDFYDSKGNKQFGKILQKTNTGYLVKDDKGKKHVLKYHDRKKAKDMLKPNYVHTEDAEAKAKLNLKHTQDMEKLKAKQAREKDAMSEGTITVDDYVGHRGGGQDPKKLGIKVKKVGSGSHDGDKVTMTGSDAKLIKFAVMNLGVDSKVKNLKDLQKALSESNMNNVDKAPKNKWKATGFSQHPHKGFEGERMPKGMRDYRKKAKTPSQMRVEDAYRQMWEDGEKYAPIDENIERGIMKKMRKGKVAKGMPR